MIFEADEISSYIEEVFAVTSQFAAALSKNAKVLLLVLKEHCRRPSASLLNFIEALVKLPEIRKTMSSMLLSSSKDNISMCIHSV